MSGSPKRRIGKMVLNVVLAVAAIYVAGVLALALMQRSLIYPAPADSAPVPAGFERVSYKTADGLNISSGYHPADEGMPTILFFHGNGARWQDATMVARLAMAKGYGVLGAEYRGYQGNPGDPTEAGLYEDGRGAVAFLAGQGVSASDIVLIGNSLGSGVATQLATEIEPRALILISPFASLTRAVQEKVRWAPVSFVLQDDFDNIGKLAKIAEPILILHGENDALIAPRHALDMAEANQSIRLAMVADAGHELAYLPFIQQPMDGFLSGLPPQP